MTKEYLLSKTLGGADIIQHLIRKEFPDHIMHVKGQDCGECPDPVWADGSIIQVTLDRIPIEGTKMAEYRARYHYPDGQMLDGDAIALAMAYYHQRGEDLSLEQLIARLDEAGRLYNVIIIKTPLTMPYTTTFFQLDCAYWNGDQQQKLDQKMAE